MKRKPVISKQLKSEQQADRVKLLFRNEWEEMKKSGQTFKLVVLIFIMILFSIFLNQYINKQKVQLLQLKKETQELEIRYKARHEDITNITKQSAIVSRLEKEGMKEIRQPSTSLPYDPSEFDLNK